jgi:hypothetical protein
MIRRKCAISPRVSSLPDLFNRQSEFECASEPPHMVTAEFAKAGLILFLFGAATTASLGDQLTPSVQVSAQSIESLCDELMAQESDEEFFERLPAIHQKILAVALSQGSTLEQLEQFLSGKDLFALPPNRGSASTVVRASLAWLRGELETRCERSHRDLEAETGKIRESASAWILALKKDELRRAGQRERLRQLKRPLHLVQSLSVQGIPVDSAITAMPWPYNILFPFVKISNQSDYFITRSATGILELWSLPSCHKLREIGSSDDPITAAAFSLDGALLITGAESGRIRAEVPESGSLKWTSRPVKLPTAKLVCTQDDRLFASHWDNALQENVNFWWGLGSTRPRRHQIPIGGVFLGYRAQEERLITTDRKRIFGYDLKNKETAPEGWYEPTQGSNATIIGEHPSGEYFVVQDQTTREIRTILAGKWDTEQVYFRKSEARTQTSYAALALRMAEFEYDSPFKISLWNLSSSGAAASQELDLATSSGIKAAALSPSGDLLAISLHDGRITLWETKTWQQLDTTLRLEYAFPLMTWSPDERYLFAQAPVAGNKIRILIYAVYPDDADSP